MKKKQIKCIACGKVMEALRATGTDGSVWLLAVCHNKGCPTYEEKHYTAEKPNDCWTKEKNMKRRSPTKDVKCRCRAKRVKPSLLVRLVNKLKSLLRIG